MDRELAFSTFLKLLELPEVNKAATLRGFKRGGGFNYWRPLQALAPDVASRKLALAPLQEKVGLISKGHQRKYNEDALTRLLKWAGRRKISVRQHPGKVVKKFGTSGLSIRLEPELAFSMDGRDYLMHLWATNNPPLSEETLSMGLYFFRTYFKKQDYSNFQYLIFDTVKERIFAEFQIVENARELLVAQRDLLDALWTKIDSEDASKSKKPPHGDRPGEKPAAPI